MPPSRKSDAFVPEQEYTQGKERKNPNSYRTPPIPENREEKTPSQSRKYPSTIRTPTRKDNPLYTLPFLLHRRRLVDIIRGAKDPSSRRDSVIFQQLFLSELKEPAGNGGVRVWEGDEQVRRDLGAVACSFEGEPV